MRMKIKTNNPSFKANLTKEIISLQKKIDLKLLEKTFIDNFGIDTKFNNNDNAICFSYTLNIFEDISNNYNLFNCSYPPRIRIFDRNNLINKNSTDSFCISNSKQILRNENVFELRSIFIKKNNLLDINQKTEKNYKNKISSSPHFLANYIHEWLHNIHLDNIYKKYGYDGNCPFAQSLYSKTKIGGLHLLNNWTTNINMNNNIKNLAYNELGSYSTTSIMEFFAETLTKIIKQSLNKNCELKNNPLDKLIQFNPDLKKFFERILNQSLNN